MEAKTGIELTSILLEQKPTIYSSSHAPVFTDIEEVKTDWLTFHVTFQGDRKAKRPTIVTLHDIAVNAQMSFQTLFSFRSMAPLLEKFNVIHLTLPGHLEEEALPADYVFPSLDAISEAIIQLMCHYKLDQGHMFGVGAGANVMLRLSLSNPSLVGSLILVNATAGPAGWIEWAYQKYNLRTIRNKGEISSSAEEYIIWHLFGDREENKDLMSTYRYHLHRMNPTSIAGYMQAYLDRTALKLPANRIAYSRAPILLMIGDWSPHIDDTVELNNMLPADQTQFCKFQDGCGMLLEDSPHKISEALLLFFQGQGYAPHAKKIPY